MKIIFLIHIVKYIKITKAHNTVFPHYICPVIAAAVPHRLTPAVVPVSHRLKSLGGGYAEIIKKPLSALFESHDLCPAFICHLFDVRILEFQTFAHSVPTETIFLSCLSILDWNSATAERLFHKPINPYLRSTARIPYRLKGWYSIIIIIRNLIVISINSIRTEHSKNGHINLIFRIICRAEHIIHRRIIRTVIISALHCISVCPHLVTADTASLNMIFFGKVFHRDSINMPRTNTFGIISENAFKPAHCFINKSNTIFGTIAYEKSYVTVPVPRISSSPFKTDLFS